MPQLFKTPQRRPPPHHKRIMVGDGEGRAGRASGGSPPEIQPVGAAAAKDRSDGDDEFEFVCDAPEVFSTADEIFCNGIVRPVYPVIGRKEFARPGWLVEKEEAEDVGTSIGNLLLREKREGDGEMVLSCSSSESDEMDGLPEDSYCLWKPGSVPPSPDLRKKSMSTGSSNTSSSRRWRFRDLIVRRTRSDGEKTLAFLRRKAQVATSALSRSDGTQGNSVELGEWRSSEELCETKRRFPRSLVSLSAHSRVYHMKGGKNVADGGDQRRPYSFTGMTLSGSAERGEPPIPPFVRKSGVAESWKKSTCGFPAPNLNPNLFGLCHCSINVCLLQMGRDWWTCKGLGIICPDEDD